MSELVELYANKFYQSEYKDRPELMEGWIMNEFKKDLYNLMQDAFSENDKA